MNTKEFKEGIELLQMNYNKTLTTEQLKLYYENLKDMDRNKYIANIKNHIKNNAFMPNIAQIRNEMRKQFANYEQRDYSNMDLSKFYIN